MGSSDTDLKALDSVITVAGALAAIFGDIRRNRRSCRAGNFSRNRRQFLGFQLTSLSLGPFDSDDQIRA